MSFVTTNLKTSVYIQSEAEFSRAKMSGVWETLATLFTRQRSQLLSFNDVVEPAAARPTCRVGLRDVPLNQLVGSVSRAQNFTRLFRPRRSDHNSKERWRNIYTLAVTGQGFPPIEVFKVGQQYFVEDGHHRISVAKHLGWKTIQANVVELSPLLEACSAEGSLVWSCEGCAC